MSTSSDNLLGHMVSPRKRRASEMSSSALAMRPVAPGESKTRSHLRVPVANTNQADPENLRRIAETFIAHGNQMLQRANRGRGFSVTSQLSYNTSLDDEAQSDDEPAAAAADGDEDEEDSSEDEEDSDEEE